MPRYRKAIAAGLIAGLGAITTALADDLVTTQEWVTAIVAAVVAVGAVYQIPNRPV